MIDHSENREPYQKQFSGFFTFFLYLLFCFAATGCLASSELFRTYMINMRATSWGKYIAPIFPFSVLFYGIIFSGGDLYLYSRGNRKLAVLLLIGFPIGIVALFAVTYALSMK